MPSKSKTKSAKAAAVKVPQSQSSKDEAQLPNWPALAPLVPSLDLSIEEILQDQILVIRNLFTSTLCKTYVSFLSALPLTTTPGKPKRGEALRVNDRFQIEDHTFAQHLWSQTGLKQLVESHEDQTIWGGGEILGLYSNIRVYRYRPGQFFDQHYDESKKVEFGPDKISAKTVWTLLIYLTTCEGGETVFYPEAKSKKDKTPEPIVCGLETGMALLHKHGDDCLLHEGREVMNGEKWVLRSDLVVTR